MTVCAAEALPTPYVRQLDPAWLVYDDTYEGYVPFYERRHANANALHLRLLPTQFGGYALHFNAHDGVCLFVAGHLTRCYEQSGTYTVDLSAYDTLRSALWLTFHHPQSAYDHVSGVQLVHMGTATPGTAAQGQSSLQPQRRSTLPGREFVTIALLLLGIGYAAVRRVAGPGFQAFFRLSRFFTDHVSDYSGDRRMGATSLLLILLNCLTIGMVLYALQQSYEQAAWLGFLRTVRRMSILGQVLYLALLVLSYYGLQLVVIYLFGWLFQLRGVAAAHYFEFIRFTTFTGLAMALLVIALFNVQAYTPAQLMPVVGGVAATLLLLRVLKVGILLGKSASYHILYLFSYLCATELIPIFIVIKLFDIS